jgi:hypothetical protein
MQYDEHRLALLAATVAAGFAANSKLLDALTDKKKVRAEARNLARVSVLLASHHGGGAPRGRKGRRIGITVRRCRFSLIRRLRAEQ